MSHSAPEKIAVETREDLDPSLWSSLPEFVVELILMRLPLRDIDRLRCLSRSWRSLISPNSDFMRKVFVVHSKIVAFCSGEPDRNTGAFRFKLLDVAPCEWHVLNFTPPRKYTACRASHDGGLVCFFNAVDRWDVGVLPTVPMLVFNPLSNAQRVLPLQNLSPISPNMVQLVLDRDTGQYEVVVVGWAEALCGCVAEIYDSGTGMWSPLHSGDVFDFKFDYLDYDEDYVQGNYRAIEIFDCAAKDFYYPVDGWPHCSEIHTQFKGSHFVLKSPGQMFTILEYLLDGDRRLRLRKKTAVPSYIRDVEVIPQGHLPTLLACNDFIMLIADNLCTQRCVVSLFDRASRRWILLPQDELYDIFVAVRDEMLMCDIQWDAIP